MSDWIKLPSGGFLNLDRFISVAEKAKLRTLYMDDGSGTPYEYATDGADARAILAALKKRIV